jgi:hypothetical protein
MKEYNKRRNDYYHIHKVCPKCKEVPHYQTYLGFINPSDENPDTNECVCKCGWRGLVHELIEGKLKDYMVIN